MAAASARITALEESLGLRVFERSSRGVRLTPAGQMLVRRGRELLVDIDRLSVDLHDYAKGLQGHVRLAANTSAMLELLPAKLDRMTREHPLIRIDVAEHGSLDIPLLLLEGRADLGIVDMAHAPHGISLPDCFSDTLALVVPPAMRWLAPPDRAGGRAGRGLHRAARRHALSAGSRSASVAGKPLKIRMQMRSFDAVCRMVAGGLGVAVLPLQAIGPQLASLPLAAVRSPTPGPRARTASRCAAASSPRRPR